LYSFERSFNKRVAVSVDVGENSVAVFESSVFSRGRGGYSSLAARSQSSEGRICFGEKVESQFVLKEIAFP
jgi:hypothetical protein